MAAHSITASARRLAPWVALTGLAISLAAACTAPASSALPSASAALVATPSPSIEATASATPEPCPPVATTPEPLASLPADLDESIREAIQQRFENGLRRDLAWVQQVAEDPTATTEFGFPLLPAESASLFARNGRTFMVETLLREYDQGPEFGGIYMDNALGGVVVVLWTADPSAIEAELAPRLPPCFPILFREVRWSEAELRRWQNAIALQSDWFAGIDASLRGVGADTKANDVVVEISSANAGAEEAILDHFGAPEGMVRVESDGTGAALLPWGTVVGRVLTADGQPVGANDLMVDYGGPDDPPGWCGGGDIGYGVRSNGSFEYPCHVGRRTIRVLDWVGDGDHQVVASTVVDVRDGREVKVTIRLPEGFDPLATP